MQEKEFRIVSNNVVYECSGMEEVIHKMKVLNLFNFAYRVYYLCKGEWTEMLISPEELISTYDKGVNDGLKGVMNNEGC